MAPKPKTSYTKAQLESLGIEKTKRIAMDEYGMRGVSGLKLADLPSLIRMILAEQKEASPSSAKVIAGCHKTSAYTLAELREMGIVKCKAVAREMGITGISHFKLEDIDALARMIVRSPHGMEPGAGTTSKVKVNNKVKVGSGYLNHQTLNQRYTRDMLHDMGIVKCKALAKDLGITGISHFKLADLDQLADMILRAAPTQKAPGPSSSRSASRSASRSRLTVESGANQQPYTRHMLHNMGIVKSKAVAREMGITGISHYKLADLDTLVDRIMSAQR
jgi:hypothetical protein